MVFEMWLACVLIFRLPLVGNATDWPQFRGLDRGNVRMRRAAEGMAR